MESSPLTQGSTQWYILYTSPRAEKQVYNRLLAKGLETWLPIHRAPRVWSDRVKIVDVPLFRSYIFVRCSLPMVYTLPMVYGVASIVMHDGKPAFLRQTDISAIQQFLLLADKRPILVGDHMEILAGPMKKVSGKVMRVDNKYVSLYIEQMGVVMQVSGEQIRFVDKGR